MKQFKLLILTVALFASIAHADNHNLTSDAIGNLLGLSNIEYSYKIASHLTFGLRGTSGKASLGDYDLSGNSYGAVTRWYQQPALENDSWYFGATVDKENFELKTTSNFTEYKANFKDVVAGIGGGYQWFWKSFNIGMGAYGTNRENIDLKDSQGNNYKDSVGSRLAIELTMGGKF